MKRLLSGILIALVGMLLLSCGGGGGGGGSTGLTYTGLSSQATLSSSNSQEMSSAALEGGQSGNALGGRVCQCERRR